MRSLLQAEHISKQYVSSWPLGRRHEALHEVSFTLNEGEIFALLGVNGAGKTTLMRVLLGLVRPGGGSITFPERSSIGYLPETFRVQGDWTPLSLLRFLGTLSGLKGALLRERIDEALITVGLTHAAQKKVNSFSKGMMLRLGLAQAILHRPQLLFLDEPTDGLDPLGRIDVRTLLFRLREEGSAVLLNSHQLSEVELVADRVGILHRGAITASGTLHELLPRKTAFTVELDEPPAGELPCKAEQRGSSWFYAVDSVESLTSLLERLRAHGAPVKAVTAERSSLEELFRSHIQ